MRGRTLSKETKDKIRNLNIGKHHSESTKQKMSATHKLLPHKRGYKISQEGRKNMSIARLGNKSTFGCHWFNNGIKNVVSKECPEGFVAGRIPFNKKEEIS